MKALSYTTAYKNLTSYATMTTYIGIAETLSYVLQHALQDKNVQLETLTAIRSMTDKGVKQLQIAIGKTFPIKWNKEEKVYTFDGDKRNAMVVELGLTVNTVKGQKLTDEQKEANLELIYAWLVDTLAPEEKAPKAPTAKAWTDSQYKAQVEKLALMDNDQLAAQLKLLQALLTQAQHEQDTRITSFLGTKQSKPETKVAPQLTAEQAAADGVC